MGRIEDAFARRRTKGRKALVTYLCAGDPSEAETVELACACLEAGADVLELGSPFSDPTADGPAIERASQRALANGGGLDTTLRVAKAVRQRHENAAIVLFGYYNPLFVRGEARAVALAAEHGVDAFLVVDLPIDAADGLRTAAQSHGLGVIPLVAPTSRPERLVQIAQAAGSSLVPFVYTVSMMGVTGGAGASDVLAEAGRQAARVRDTTKRPAVVGFGIDSPERARIAAEGADGVVVGSAIVRRIEEEKTPSARISAVRKLVQALRDAV